MAADLLPMFLLLGLFSVSTNTRCCHVIPFWSGPRRSSSGSGYAIELLKFIWETHTNIDGGIDFDIIILNGMYDNEETNSFLSQIDGTKTKNGKFLVYNKDNIGWGFGSHAYAYEKLRNEYDYWFFRSQILKLISRIVKQSCNILFTLSYPHRFNLSCVFLNKFSVHFLGCISS